MNKPRAPKYQQELQKGASITQKQREKKGKVLPFNKKGPQGSDQDKQSIQQYQQKINELLKNPQMAKKAALIIENLLKSSKK